MIDWARFYANGGYSNENSDPESYDDGRDEDEEIDETEEPETVTYKIGDVFTLDNKTFKIVEGDTCEECYFHKDFYTCLLPTYCSSRLECSSAWRADKKDVIFKRIK